METKDTIQIESDARGHLRLLASSTFKDPICFIDEIIQNAERAEAQNIYFSTANGKLHIFNDGPILGDFKVLFQMAKSGWDSEEAKQSDPFGIGFFSVMAAATYCEIASGCKKARWDILAAQSGDLDVEMSAIPEAEYVNGFEVILSLKPGIIDHVRHRVCEIGAFCTIEVHWNRVAIEKQEAFTLNGDDMEVALNSPKFKGKLDLKSYSFYNDVSVYFKGRFVCQLPELHFATGVIHINSGVLNLTAPDRKDIVRDEKFKAFIQELHAAIHDRLVDVVPGLSLANRKDYSDMLDTYLPNLAAISIPLYILSVDNIKDIKEYTSKEVDKNFKTLASYINNRVEREKKYLSTQINSVDVVVTAGQIDTPDTNAVTSAINRETPSSGSLGYAHGSVSRDPKSQAKSLAFDKPQLYVSDSDLENPQCRALTIALIELGLKVAVLSTKFEEKYARAQALVDIAKLDSNCLTTSIVCKPPTSSALRNSCDRAASILTAAIHKEGNPEKSAAKSRNAVKVVVGDISVVETIDIELGGIKYKHTYEGSVKSWIIVNDVIAIQPSTLVALDTLRKGASLTANAWAFLYGNRKLVDELCRDCQ